jgi:hypothetical protein
MTGLRLYLLEPAYYSCGSQIVTYLSLKMQFYKHIAQQGVRLCMTENRSWGRHPLFAVMMKGARSELARK